MIKLMIKLEKFLFYVFIFLIPFQVRYVFNWQANEWNNFFLYLSDIILIGLFVFSIINKRIKFKKQDIFLFLFLFISFISIFYSSNQSIAVFRFIKLLSYSFLYMYIVRNIKFLNLKNILLVIFSSGIFQAVLGILQFIKQSSLGLKFIEPGVLKPGAYNVASFIFNDDKILRAYGSLSHPNVLAGFMLLCIFCFLVLFLKFDLKKIYLIGFSLFIFTLFLTFSRTSLTVFLILVPLYLLIKFFVIKKMGNNKERRELSKKLISLFFVFLIISILSILILSPYLKARFFTISINEEAVDLRFFYNKIAIEMIKQKPVIGIGIGNFVFHSQNYPVYLKAGVNMIKSIEPTLEKLKNNDSIPDWAYQPVHNIYLLIATELGIIGLILIGIFVLKTLIKTKTLGFAFLIIGFLIISLNDHYFYTLNSGALMFWLGLSLCNT
ncbi:MAG: O-antigen ligase family protein [Patescibacteria group bacterium]